MGEYKNKNRGYMQLRVWQDAIEYYAETCKIYRGLPSELRRVVAQQLASSDSIHRNIAEGYARRSVREYIQFLYVALASLAECVSGNCACHKAGQLFAEQFGHLDALSYKLENGLLKLVACLEQKRESGEWVDHLMVKESNTAYGTNTSKPNAS